VYTISILGEGSNFRVVDRREKTHVEMAREARHELTKPIVHTAG
jgi:hypothetical protein